MRRQQQYESNVGYIIQEDGTIVDILKFAFNYVTIDGVKYTTTTEKCIKELYNLGDWTPDEDIIPLFDDYQLKDDIHYKEYLSYK